jgi:hypothetical protein
MKSLNLYIQSAMDSLEDCSREVQGARLDVAELEEADQDPPISTVALDRILAHCQKAQRELQSLSKRVR